MWNKSQDVYVEKVEDLIRMCTKPPCPAFLDESADKETRATFGFLANHISIYQQMVKLKIN